MMRVLGKFDLNNAILFDDLVALLVNYGVKSEDKKDTSEGQHDELEAPVDQEKNAEADEKAGNEKQSGAEVN